MTPDEKRFLELVETTDARRDEDSLPKWYAREFNEAIAIANRWYESLPWWRRWWIDAKGYFDDFVFWLTGGPHD